MHDFKDKEKGKIVPHGIYDRHHPRHRRVRGRFDPHLDRADRTPRRGYV
jgi:hypothetical protein